MTPREGVHRGNASEEKEERGDCIKWIESTQNVKH